MKIKRLSELSCIVGSNFLLNYLFINQAKALKSNLVNYSYLGQCQILSKVLQMKSTYKKLSRCRFSLDLLSLPRLAALLFIVGLVFSFDLKADKFKFQLTSDSKNCLTKAEVNILKDDKLIYYFALPVSGTAEVELLWGNYNFQATNSEGCSFEKALQIFENSPELIQGSLGIVPEKPDIEKNNHISCFGQNSVCDGGLYPFSGDLFGRFQAYVTNPSSGTSFTISPKYENLKWLATTPSITGNALEFNQQKSGFSFLNVDYDFISYSVRFDDEFLQKEQGFCGLKNQATNFMVEGLEKNKFPLRSVQDFKGFINKQLANNFNYCVYPQLNKHIDRAMPLKTEISNQTEYQLIRAFYTIVLAPKNNQRVDAFRSKYPIKPAKKWNHSPRTLTPKITTIYEWGIGYELQ